MLFSVRTCCFLYLSLSRTHTHKHTHTQCFTGARPSAGFALLSDAKIRWMSPLYVLHGSKC